MKADENHAGLSAGWPLRGRGATKQGAYTFYRKNVLLQKEIQSSYPGERKTLWYGETSSLIL